MAVAEWVEPPRFQDLVFSDAHGMAMPIRRPDPVTRGNNGPLCVRIRDCGNGHDLWFTIHGKGSTYLGPGLHKKWDYLHPLLRSHA